MGEVKGMSSCSVTLTVPATRCPGVGPGRPRLVIASAPDATEQRRDVVEG
jgi:hypothetical protein